MFSVVITEKGGAQRRMEFDKNEVTIGRVQGNDIILPKGNVSKRHSRIVLKDSRFIVVDLKSTNGTYVNGRKITSPLVVKPGDKIYIGDFILTLEDQPGAGAQPDYAAEEPAPAPPQPQPGPPPLRSSPSAPNLQMQGPPPLAPQPPPLAPPPSVGGPPPLPSSERSSSEPPRRFNLDEEPAEDSHAGPALSAPMPPPVHHSPVHSPQPAMHSAPAHSPQPVHSPAPIHAPPAPMHSPPPVHSPQPVHAPQPVHSPPMHSPPAHERPVERSAPMHSPPAHSAPVAPPTSPPPPLAVMQVGPGMHPGRPSNALRAVMARLGESFDLHNADPHALHDVGRRAQAQGAIDAAISSLRAEGALDSADSDHLATTALCEAVGLGAIEPLLSHDSVREIVVEGPQHVLADFGNGLESTGGGYSSATALLTTCRRLLAQAGESLDLTRPVHEGRLPYGPHVMVVLPPVAVRGPILEIRRTARGASADDLVGKGVMNKAMLDVLKQAVSRRRNIAVVGTVGAGVTTVLGAIAGLCDDGERIVTAEDVPDLDIDREHVISLATGNARSGLSLVDVVRQASRLRSDRLVVDDVHGTNAFDVLTEAASRGEGTFLGLHCAGGEDPVAAVSLLARLGGRLTDAALGGLLSRAVHVLVQVARTEEGRRITSISELSSGNDGSLKSNNLFVYDGEFAAKGRPSFAT